MNRLAIPGGLGSRYYSSQVRGITRGMSRDDADHSWLSTGKLEASPSRALDRKKNPAGPASGQTRGCDSTDKVRPENGSAHRPETPTRTLLRPRAPRRPHSSAAQRPAAGALAQIEPAQKEHRRPGQRPDARLRFNG